MKRITRRAVAPGGSSTVSFGRDLPDLGGADGNHLVDAPHTQRMQIHEKTAWMLRSLLQD